LPLQTKPLELELQDSPLKAPKGTPVLQKTRSILQTTYPHARYFLSGSKRGVNSWQSGGCLLALFATSSGPCAVGLTIASKGKCFQAACTSVHICTPQLREQCLD